MEQMRKEIEAADAYRGTVLWHSTGGGTGSGVGSKLSEMLRDTYPRSHILTVGVVAGKNSESPLYNYNSAFSLSCLHENADGILLMENETLIRNIETHQSKAMKIINSSRSVNNSYDVPMKTINQYAARQLSGMFFPTKAKKGFYDAHLSRAHRRPFDLGALVEATCPLWDVKLLDLQSSCSLSNRARRHPRRWEQVVDTFSSTIPKFDETQAKVETFGTKVYIRSSANATPAKRSKKSNSLNGNKRGPRHRLESKRRPDVLPDDYIRRQLGKAFKHASWFPEMSQLRDITYSLEQPLPWEDKSITVCANTTRHIPVMQRLSSRGREMFRSRAFVHWFTRFGIEEDDFFDVFESLDRVVDAYGRCSGRGGTEK
jgi:tubulin delta